MAGNYPDLASWRMALDRDGSVLLAISTNGGVFQFPSGEATDLLNEDAAYFSGNAAVFTGSNFMIWKGVVFPEARDVDAYMLKESSGSTALGPLLVQVSTDTTNLLDGNWTTINAAYNSVPSATVNRVGITSSTALAVKGIRFQHTNAQPYLRTIHLYGEIAPGENPDRLVFWEPLTDAKLNPSALDWGDVPRSSSADRIVRVKNVSGTKTAANVRVSFDIMTDSASPSVPGQFLLSFGGGAFLSQVNVGTLAPGAISGPVTVRRVTPSNAALGLWLPRISAVADSMT